MKKLLLSVFTILHICIAFGQVDTSIFPNGDAYSFIPRIKTVQSKKNVVRNFPRIDLAKLLEEDEKRKGENIPFRFGKGFDVSIPLDNENWSSVQDGRIWSMEFQSTGAFSINFVFDELYLAEGAELYIINKKGSVVYGPVTSNSNSDSGHFMTDLIDGDHVVLYLYEPIEQQGKSRFKISRVVHGYKRFGQTPNSQGDALGCNNDINCFPAWDLQSDAVGMVLLSDGTEWCSGSLLMTSDQSFRPYFLSAFHCIDSNSNGTLTAAERANAEDWMFKFEFKSTTCNGSYANPGVTFNSATFRAAWQNTDFALMEMDNSPIGDTRISWAGWNRNGNTPTSGTGIHHPSGDLMKISFDNNNLQQNTATINWPGETTSPPNSHWTVGFDNGTTEGGSSGSPLFDQNSRVVGQLHGGSSGCAPVTKYYGQFDNSWDGGGTNATRLSNWLDPCANGGNTTNTTRTPYMTGASIFCSSGSTITLNGLPAGSTISWSNSGNISRNSSQGSNPCTFSANGTGTGWIQAIVTPPNACGNTFTLRRNIWAGKPTNTGINLGVWFSSPPNNQVHIYSSEAIGLFSNPNETAQGVTGYQWQFGSWSSYISGYQTVSGKTKYAANIYLDPTAASSQIVTVAAQNPCGYDLFVNPAGKMFYKQGGGSFMMVYPNPANSEIFIEKNMADRSTGTDNQGQANGVSETSEGALDIEVYDFNGNMIWSETFRKSENIPKIDVTGFKKGIHFLRIIGQKVDETHQIVIE